MDNAPGFERRRLDGSSRTLHRREHKKSRNGCTACKKRRVKCDEKMPCSNCLRRKEDCDNFLPQSVRTCKNCSDQQNAAVSPQVLYLMYHYTKHTSLSLMDNKEMRRNWEEVIPEEALKHPILMEGLLAMSALHLASRRPTERTTWTPLALKHQSIALSHFRSTIADINQDNCHAFLALSILIVVTSMAFTSFGTILGPGETIPTSDIIEPFNLIRGIGQVIGVAVQGLATGPLRSILVGHTVNICQAPVPNPIAERFRQLHQMVTVMCPEKKIGEVLAETIESLQYVFTELVSSEGTESNKNPGIAWKWPYMCSQDYSILLKESHGGALVIFAHFALLSKTWDSNWYLHGWAPRVVDGIYAAVEPCWKQWLEWPQQQIRDGYPILDTLEKSEKEEIAADEPRECSPAVEPVPPAVDIIDDQGNFALKLPWKGEMIPMPQTLDKFRTNR